MWILRLLKYRFHRVYTNVNSEMSRLSLFRIGLAKPHSITCNRHINCRYKGSNVWCHYSETNNQSAMVCIKCNKSTRKARLFVLNARKIFETLSVEARAINVTTTLCRRTLTKGILQLYFSDWRIVYICFCIVYVRNAVCNNIHEKLISNLKTNSYFDKVCAIEEQKFYCDVENAS